MHLVFATSVLHGCVVEVSLCWLRFFVFLAVFLQALLAGVHLCDAKSVSACAGGKRGKAPLPRVLILSFGLCRLCFSFCRPFFLGRGAFWRGERVAFGRCGGFTCHARLFRCRRGECRAGFDCGTQSAKVKI